jgi:hypothetical protein
MLSPARLYLKVDRDAIDRLPLCIVDPDNRLGGIGKIFIGQRID